MKLLLIVVQREDLPELLDALIAAQFRATVIGSRGGFLSVGSVTVMIGVDATLVDEVTAIVRRVCRHRVRASLPLVPTIEPGMLTMPVPGEVAAGGAVCFTLSVARFVRIEGTPAEPPKPTRLARVARAARR